jgi:hypothetical protein
MEHLFGGWMDRLILSVGISRWVWTVRDLDQEDMKSISLGSQQFGKVQ